MNCWFMASDMGGIVSQWEERYVPAVTLCGEARGIKGTNTGGQVWSGTLCCDDSNVEG